MSQQEHESRIAEILHKHQQVILAEWIENYQTDGAVRQDLFTVTELQEKARQFLSLLEQAAQHGDFSSMETSEWGDMRAFLESLSGIWAEKGGLPAEVATFLLSIKQPLFNQLRDAYKRDGEGLIDDIWKANILVDKLGLYTTSTAHQNLEQIIARQQRELLEISTPVVTLWEDILALPLIGALDSTRAQVVMENLLQRIVETGAEIAILDITGVPTVDTLVAQHLLKAVAAARLMGADCIISGIRPEIAQTMVHLGVDLGNVATKATLASAFALALQRTGRFIGKQK